MTDVIGINICNCILIFLIMVGIVGKKKDEKYRNQRLKNIQNP